MPLKQLNCLLDKVLRECTQLLWDEKGKQNNLLDVFEIQKFNRRPLFVNQFNSGQICSNWFSF